MKENPNRWAIIEFQLLFKFILFSYNKHVRICNKESNILGQSKYVGGVRDGVVRTKNDKIFL